MINIIQLGDGSVVGEGDAVAIHGSRRKIGFVHSIIQGRPVRPWSEREIAVRMDEGGVRFFHPQTIMLHRA